MTRYKPPTTATHLGGLSAAYGETSETCVCGARLHVQVQTDGNGGLIEPAVRCGSCGLVRSARKVGGKRRP